MALNLIGCCFIAFSILLVWQALRKRSFLIGLAATACAGVGLGLLCPFVMCVFKKTW